jgi:hypothetical protein
MKSSNRALKISIAATIAVGSVFATAAPAQAWTLHTYFTNTMAECRSAQASVVSQGNVIVIRSCRANTPLNGYFFEWRYR